MKRLRPIVLKDTTYTPGFSALVELSYSGYTYIVDECSVIFNTEEIFVFRSKYNKVVLKRFLGVIGELDVTPKLLLSLGFKKEGV